jgi:hypothetical protein
MAEAHADEQAGDDGADDSSADVDGSEDRPTA